MKPHPSHKIQAHEVPAEHRMDKPCVLLLSTYAFRVPRHGGQVRLANIAKAFEKAGFSVSSLAVCESRYPGFGQDDLVFPNLAPHNLFAGREILIATDYLSGVYAAENHGAWPQICSRFLNERIDVIYVEQPWLWPLARKLRALDNFSRSLLVYGSNNIEAPLRRDILKSYGQVDDEFIGAIDHLERQASCEADLAIAVTEDDGMALKEFGAKKIVIAPNGIAPWAASVQHLKQWKKKLPQVPWALYIASAHPPNFTGFVDCVGEALGGIPPDSKLVIAGGVCDPLRAILASSRWSDLNMARTQYLGQLSDDDLAAVKSLASVYCLPITYGGGSNIKTAEALYSGASVIGSVSAFRGFDSFVNLPQVNLVHSPAQFQERLRNLLMMEPIPVDAAGRVMRVNLEWESCLAAIPKAVLSLL